MKLEDRKCLNACFLGTMDTPYIINFCLPELKIASERGDTEKENKIIEDIRRKVYAMHRDGLALLKTRMASYDRVLAIIEEETRRQSSTT